MNHLQERIQSRNTSPADEISWRESEDISFPIPRSLPDFLSEIQLLSQHSLPSWKQDEFLVFFEESCLKQMQGHACADLLREQAGILSGQVYVDDGRHYVSITSTCPANTVGDAVHFRFHKDSWAKIWQQLKKGDNILGWYHTHPGLGVFLSPTDLRTQQIHFRLPWSVAVVIDPISHESGIFAGSKGTKIGEASCFSYLCREAQDRSEDAVPAPERVYVETRSTHLQLTHRAPFFSPIHCQECW